MSWKDYPIFKREDGSYVIVQNESPYHVPNEGEWAVLYAEVHAYYEADEAARAERELLYEDLHPEDLPPPPTPEDLAALALEQAKAERAAAVAAITVTVDGLVFDGDEKAQERMARAVLMAESPEESIEWVLADNTVAMVTAEQLRSACRAAGKAMGVLWVKPYQTGTESTTSAGYSVS